MSVDMSSQASDSNEEDFEEEENEGAEEEDQGDMTYYYEGVAGDVEQAEPDTFDPEEYQFTCLTYRESQRLLTEEVNHVSTSLKVCICGVSVSECLVSIRKSLSWQDTAEHICILLRSGF